MWKRLTMKSIAKFAVLSLNRPLICFWMVFRFCREIKCMTTKTTNNTMIGRRWIDCTNYTPIQLQLEPPSPPPSLVSSTTAQLLYVDGKYRWRPAMFVVFSTMKSFVHYFSSIMHICHNLRHFIQACSFTLL